MAKNSCQKKWTFKEILGIKVVQFWCYTKLVIAKNVPLDCYSSTIFFYKDSDDFWRWKLTLKIRFWHFMTAIFGHLTSLMKKSNPFLWSVQSYLQSEMFFIKFCWHDENLTPKTYSREQYDFIIHKEESYFELLVIFKSWLHWIYSFLSCPSAKIPTLKKLTFVPFCITTRDIHIECSKQFKWNSYIYVSGKAGRFGQH